MIHAHLRTRRRHSETEREEYAGGRGDDDSCISSVYLPRVFVDREPGLPLRLWLRLYVHCAQRAVSFCFVFLNPEQQLGEGVAPTLLPRVYFHLVRCTVLCFVVARRGAARRGRLRSISVVAGGAWPPVGSVVASLSASAGGGGGYEATTQRSEHLSKVAARFGSAVTMRTLAVLESSEDDSDADVVNLDFNDMGTPIHQASSRARAAAPQRQSNAAVDASTSSSAQAAEACASKFKHIAGAGPRRPRTKSIAKVLGVDVDEGFFPQVR